MTHHDTEPFDTVDSAWIWTMGALRARHDGARTRPAGTIPRPCDPDDIVRALDRLYRNRRIDLLHARILRIYGEMGRAPDGRYPRERSDARIWAEAMDRLGAALIAKGIVKPDVFTKAVTA